jgi:transposase
MCVRPVPWPEPDPLVAAAIAAKYRGKRPRPLAVLIRDRLGQWLRDEDFAAAFGTRGRPGWSPSRLALVTVLQRAENLTDRQAAEAVRTRIDWQYLLGLPVDDPGFDHTVLAEFRGRVAGAGLEQVALDALLARLVSEGLVKAGGKQRTDSTRVVAAVAALTRLQLAGGKRAGGAGSPGGGAPGLAGTAGLRARFRPPLRHPDDLLAAAALPAGAG